MIERWSEGIAGENMPEEILLDLAAIVDRHPWWRARARLTIRLLRDLDLKPPARVLDAGCGWGITLGALEKRGYQVIGLDVSRRALERLDRPGRLLVEADLTRPIEPRGSTLRRDPGSRRDRAPRRRPCGCAPAREPCSAGRARHRQRAGAAGDVHRV